MAAGKGAGAGYGNASLNSKISCLKGTLFSFNVFTWVRIELNLNCTGVLISP
jgi:hypothetical protein